VCRIAIRAVARPVKTSGPRGPPRAVETPAPIVAAAAATSDPSDTMRVDTRAPTPPATAQADTSGEIASRPPNAVATLLPPRKPANTGHECPTIAARPALT
jgi:hypothetical protein